MNIQDIRLKPFQDKFVFSDRKMVAVVSGVGSGKSLGLLLKAYLYGMKWPNSTILIIRKNYSDLVRSTMADWEKFFDCKIPGDGIYHFPNGSQAFFMHSGERGDFSAIKSINAAMIACDQAEELSLENINHFQTRLRQQQGADVRPLILCANANGHDFIYKLFVAGAKTINVLGEHGQKEYLQDDMALYTATSFVNEDVLPTDTIKSWKAQELIAPNFFRRMVMNSFEEEIAADLVFPMLLLEQAQKVDFKPRLGYGVRIVGVDPAHLGNDNTGLVIIQQTGALHWEVILCTEWTGRDAPWTTGESQRIANQNQCDTMVVDSDGLGAPISAFIRSSSFLKVIDFHNTPYSYEKNKFYGNKRTKIAFEIREMISRGHLKITDAKLIKELNEAFRFKYTTAGEQKILISKEKMRSEGIPSPGLGDALIFACSEIANVQDHQKRQYANMPTTYGDNWHPFAPDSSRDSRHGTIYEEDDPFKSAGIR